MSSPKNMYIKRSSLLKPANTLNFGKATYDLLTYDKRLTSKLLSKSSTSRKQVEIQILQKLTENIQFFKSEGSETHEKCMKKMMFLEMEKGTKVFEMGSFGNKFYVILKGKVGVHVRIASNNKEEDLLEKKDEFIEIKVLNAGQSFGELALLENRPRAATIICKEKCAFAILEKNNFDNILKEIEQKKLYKQINFFSKMKMFDTWSYSSIKNLFLITDQRRYSNNEIVYNQGEEPLALFMIKSGEFQISKKIWLGKEENEYNKTNGPMIEKKFNIAILTERETFGEEELIEKSKREFTVKCISSYGDVYMLKKKDFENIIVTNDQCFGSLLDSLYAKKKTRQNRIDNFKIKFEPIFLVNKNFNNNCDNSQKLTITQSSVNIEKFKELADFHDILGEKNYFSLKNYNIKDILYPQSATIDFKRKINKIFRNPDLMKRKIKERKIYNKKKMNNEITTTTIYSNLKTNADFFDENYLNFKKSKIKSNQIFYNKKF